MLFLWSLVRAVGSNRYDQKMSLESDIVAVTEITLLVSIVQRYNEDYHSYVNDDVVVVPICRWGGGCSEESSPTRYYRRISKEKSTS